MKCNSLHEVRENIDRIDTEIKTYRRKRILCHTSIQLLADYRKFHLLMCDTF